MIGSTKEQAGVVIKNKAEVKNQESEGTRQTHKNESQYKLAYANRHREIDQRSDG